MNLTKLILLLLLLSNAPSLFSQNKNALYFDSGKADLKPESETILKTLVDQILTYSDVDLRIEAFTDDKGTETYNRQLAQKRAETVRVYLLKHQINFQKFDIRPIGELALDEKEADIEDSRRKNRRVDIYFTPISISNINDLSTRLIANSTTTQDIQPDKANTIVGPNGVKVEIPADVFVFGDGKQPKNTVKITLKEAIKPSDWIFNNLSTVATDGQIMSSGGMFNLEATSDGKPLSLLDGKKVRISVPSMTNNPNPEMQFFYGANHNPTAPQPVAWRDNKTDWEDANANNTDRFGFVQNLSKRYNACDVKNNYPSPEVLNFNIKQLSIATGAKPVPPNLEEPLVPKIKNYDNLPLPKGTFAQKKEIKKREEAIAKSVASFDKRNENYQNKLKEFTKAWEDYRADSINYIEAKSYLAQCQAKIQIYEEQYVKKVAVDNFNRTVFSLQYRIKYRKSLMDVEALKDSVTKQNRESIYTNLSYNVKRSAAGLRIYDTAYSFLSQIIQKDKELESEYNRLIDSSLQVSNLMVVNNDVQKEYNSWLQNKLSLSINEVNAYVGEVSKMGWINVDVFFKYDAQSAQPVALKESEEARTFLICKKINAIIPMKRSVDKTLYGFGKVPAGLNFSVVSIKIKDGFPLLSITNFNTLPTAPLTPDYKRVSVPQLREALAAL